MINEKFLSISLVTATLAGSVALYSCKDNDPAATPAEEGTKAATELCNCFSQAANENARAACITAYESNKHKGDAAFETAFTEQIVSGECSGYLAYLGAKEAQTLCDCFAANVDDPEAQKFCFMGTGLAESIQRHDDFGDAFTLGLMTSCPDVLAVLCAIYGGCD